MLRDAGSIPSGSTLAADVCIVGAGVAGLTIARQFIGRPERVMLVEGGGLEFTRSLRDFPTLLRRHTVGEQALAGGVIAGYPYYPLRFTRARAFGGSSRAWHTHRGVHVHPLDAIDFEQRDGLPDYGWPFDRAHLDPFYERAQEVLALGPYDYDPASWEARGFGHPLPLDPDVIATQIFQFGRNGGFERFVDEFEGAENVSVVLRGVAVHIADTDGRVEQVDCATLSGNRFSIKAQTFVIATGAIEAARLLLVSRDSQATGIGNRHDLVGRHFMEHPDVAAGFLEPDPGLDAEAFRLYELQHAGDGLSVAAMVRLTDARMRAEGLLNAVIRLRATHRTEMSSAVRSARVVRRSIHHGVPVPGLPRHVARAVMGTRSIVLHAKASRSQSPPGLYGIDVMAEQAPRTSSRIRLGRRRDRLGVPLTVLDWRLSNTDLESIRRTVEIFADCVRAAGAGRVVSTLGTATPPPAVFGNWHHMGTTRMHPDPLHGVVDEHCRVHEMDNLYVTGGSVFPTGGYANPALTVVALALRLSDHLQSVAIASSADDPTRPL